MIRFPYLIPLLLVAAAACSDRQPPPAPPVDTAVVNAYADRLVLEEERRLTGMDSLVFVRRLDTVCAAHGLDRRGLEEKIERYRTDPMLWKRLYEEVANRLDTLRQPRRGS